MVEPLEPIVERLETVIIRKKTKSIIIIIITIKQKT